MSKTPLPSLVIAIVVSLAVGGIAGFFLGVASTRAGKVFLESLYEDEQNADVRHPNMLDRSGFQLKYPSNWKIDVEDENYDPDHMFCIESPGSVFVMFAMGNLNTAPEDNLRIQIQYHEKLMNGPVMERFERYGLLAGKGAILKGKVMGIRTTVRLFSFRQNGLNGMITEHYPDEDLKRAKDGLNLIESSFMLKSRN